MPTNQNYSVAAVLLTGVVGIILGYFIGINTADTKTAVSVRESGSTVAEVITPTDSTPDSRENTELAPGDAEAVAFTIDVSTLSSGQRTALKAAGVSGEKIEVTKGMVVCMEVEIGAERMLAIQNGQSPSISEGLALMGCYSAG